VVGRGAAASPVNVLIYAIDFAPRIGGEETYLLLLGEGLARRLARAEATSGVTLVTRTPAGAFDDAALSFRVVRRPTLRALWRLFGEADVVQVSGPVLLALLLGLGRRKPVVILHHLYHSGCPNGLLFYHPRQAPCPGYFQARRYDNCLRCCTYVGGRLRSLLMVLATMLRRWLCTRVAANAVVTNYVSRRLALPRSTTIYYGVRDPLARGRETAAASPPAAVRPSAAVCFAYVGRLVPEKGVALLLEAAKRLTEEGYAFRLKLIGDGPERRPLEALARAFDLDRRVAFTGFLRDESLEVQLADVDVVVMPSRWPETAGIAAIEQMMRGRLIVAADIGGLGEVAGAAGLKFDAGDLVGLTARLRQVLDDSSCVTRIGAEARQRALRLFREDRMVEEHYRIYRQLTGDR